jgi:hypothetical protein
VGYSFRRKIFQEEALVRTYILDNGIHKVYFPYRAPGENLPPMFQEYYDNLLREMETKFAERKRSADTTPSSSTRRRSKSSQQW